MLGRKERIYTRLNLIEPDRSIDSTMKNFFLQKQLNIFQRAYNSGLVVCGLEFKSQSFVLKNTLAF